MKPAIDAWRVKEAKAAQKADTAWRVKEAKAAQKAIDAWRARPLQDDIDAQSGAQQ
jgi:hypothetical protein